MTPEERAIFILEKYWNVAVHNQIPLNLNQKWNGRDKNYILALVQQFALEHVDEMLNYLNCSPMMDTMQHFMVGECKYWLEVRTKIENII